MTRARGRRAVLAGCVGTAVLLAGCTDGPEDATPTPTPEAASPTTVTATATTVAPATTAAPQPTAVPALGTGPAAPRLTLRATVDLSAATPGVASVPLAAVPTPDGGADVLLAPPATDAPLVLAAVSPRGGGLAVTSAVPVPRLRLVFGLHRLPDGSVLVAGQFPFPDSGYGFVVVDPVGGASRSAVVVPYEDGTDFATGSTVLSPDGRTLYLSLTTNVDGRHLDLLSEADVARGRQVNGRDLFEEVRRLSTNTAVPQAVGLLPRRAGGVIFLFDAYPDERDPEFGRVPTLLSYDADLEPADLPVVASTPAERLHSEGATVGSDGTVYLVADGPDGDAVIAAPPGTGTATRLVALPGHTHDAAVVVDPAGRWVLLPAPGGARAVDLASRDATTVDLGCPPEETPGALTAGSAPGTALLLGQCAAPVPGAAVLWSLVVG